MGKDLTGVPDLKTTHYHTYSQITVLSKNCVDARPVLNRFAFSKGNKGAVFAFNFEGPRTRGAGHEQVAAHPQGKQARAKQG